MKSLKLLSDKLRHGGDQAAQDTQDDTATQVSRSLWLGQVLRGHADVLEARERARTLWGLSLLDKDADQSLTNERFDVGMPSLGRNMRNHAKTEVAEVLPPHVILQLIAQFLHEEEMTESRDSLLYEFSQIHPEAASAIFSPELIASLKVEHENASNTNLTEIHSSKHKASKEKKEHKEKGKEASKTSEKEVKKDETKQKETSKLYNESWFDPIFQKALLPLLRVGIKSVPKLFDPLPENEDAEDPEVEATSKYIATEQFDDGGEDEIDVNVNDERPIEGTNCVFLPSPSGSFKGRILVAATLNQIVRWLTESPETQDQTLRIQFLTTFFSTFQMFASSEKVLSKFLQRASSQSNPIIMKNTLEVVRFWMDQFPSVFTESLRSHATSYAKTILEKDYHDEFQLLSESIHKVEDILHEERTNEENEIIPRPFDMPDPPYPKVPKVLFSPKLTLDDITEDELAHQLCILDFELFFRIKPNELVGKQWGKNKSACPHVAALLKHCDEFTRGLIKCILEGKWQPDSPSNHSAFFIRLLKIVDELRKQNNFNSLMCIYYALTSAPVSRVFRLETLSAAASSATISKKSGGTVSVGVLQLDPQSVAVLCSLLSLCSPEGNFLHYRTAYYEAPAPALPAVGIQLRDLAFIDEGMPTKVKGMLNIHKAFCTSRIINETLKNQYVLYNFQHVQQITSMINKLEVKV
eukprot:TRINITY_DN9242_c0_g1_i2.p1 TRINITY_DN9242_c0_g1~~TRINITY_DN9242_c0_g1_i2.p1  ORF type:complete len:697 (+),score=180.86 TRINITY_DN9242_c0_g1_i2:61-2151(+)